MRSETSPIYIIAVSEVWSEILSRIHPQSQRQTAQRLTAKGLVFAGKAGNKSRNDR
jgi:hypothetical protein